MPLGSIELTVKRNSPAPIPISKINQIEEGDKIYYAPAKKPKEKRRGEIAMVLAAPGREHDFTVLETKDADKPAEWTVPFRASLAVYVYGPSGLSTRKLKGFLSKDQELIAQLADYAEKTAQTEAVLHAIASYEMSGQGDNLGAALQGFAGQYGISNKLDRNAPMNEQTLAAFRTLNPALSAYDPISPSGMQRVSQTAGLAATVAGMFLGSTVGLAAGSTAMALNLKTLMFPDTDFRSAYSQAGTQQAVALCTAREPQRSRRRIGYLWALRIPDAGPPRMVVQEPNHVPHGLKSVIKLSVPDAQWKLVSRIRNWSLQPESGMASPVPVTPLSDQRGLEINLGNAELQQGKYRLTALWDWETVQAGGEIFVDPLGAFSTARITAASQNSLRQQSGKHLVTLEGADFQFLDKVAIVRTGDRYSTPASIPFTLPRGSGQGVQNTVELQVDTGSLNAGDYALLLSQKDGKPQTVNVKVLLDPPRLNGLPLTVNEGEPRSEVMLQGEGLDRILGLEAEGFEFTLEPAVPQAARRAVRVHQTGGLREGAVVPLRVVIKDYAQAIVFADAIAVAGPKPRIEQTHPSLPSDLQISLQPDELPAGLHIGVMMRVASPGSDPAVEFSCRNSTGPRIQVQAGSGKSGIKLQAIQANSLFASLDPGLWPNGCVLTAVLYNKQSGRSDPVELGRVIRLPRIENFQLTDEPAGEGSYIGMLTGIDLELIGQVGWSAEAGKPVVGLPVPIAGEGARQSLKVQLPWPSPTPRAPLFLWFRGEEKGRSTQVR